MTDSKLTRLRRHPSRIRSICFVAPWAHPIITRDERISGAGGSEIQMSYLAREFVRLGFEVSMITYDQGQPRVQMVDGVRVIAAVKPGAGLPKMGKLWAFIKFCQAMRRANADLYYQQNCGLATTYTVAYAKLSGRFAIYCGASDPDFDPSVPFLPSRLEALSYRWAIRSADRVVAQSIRQKDAAEKCFGARAEVIRSYYAPSGSDSRFKGRVIWAGTIKPIKRPDLLIELAQRCPEIMFHLVGGGSGEYFDAIQSQIAVTPNVVPVGFLPPWIADTYFDAAGLLVNTSDTEGFPNTFLQAWSRGVPTLSFFDPDCYVDGKPAGLVARDLDHMASLLRRVTTDVDFWSDMSLRCRSYFASHFSAEEVISSYLALFAKLEAGS